MGLVIISKGGIKLTGNEEKDIDLRVCKKGVRQYLPVGNPVRMAIESEPDFLPRKEGLAKLETYMRILMATQ